MKYCWKCGNELVDEATVCPKCGCSQTNRQGSNNNSTNQWSADGKGIAMGGSEILNTDFSSLKPYYQERFQRILNSNEQDTGGWNWCAFLFGPLWALSKGLWLSALIMIAASVITAGALAVVVWFIYGFRGNYMYYCKHVKNQQRII